MKSGRQFASPRFLLVAPLKNAQLDERGQRLQGGEWNETDARNWTKEGGQKADEPNVMHIFWRNADTAHSQRDFVGIPECDDQKAQTEAQAEHSTAISISN